MGRRGFCWSYCADHEDYVLQTAVEHADPREFPLSKVSADELPVWEVMES